MGVKFGTDVAFSYAFNNTLTQRQVRGGEILAFRKRIRERRISIQNQYPVSGRQGRGRKKPSVYSAPSNSRNRTSGPK